MVFSFLKKCSRIQKTFRFLHRSTTFSSENRSPRPWKSAKKQICFLSLPLRKAIGKDNYDMCHARIAQKNASIYCQLILVPVCKNEEIGSITGKTEFNPVATKKEALWITPAIVDVKRTTYRSRRPIRTITRLPSTQEQFSSNSPSSHSSWRLLDPLHQTIWALWNSTPNKLLLL